MRLYRRFVLFAALLAVAVVIAACGSSNSSNKSSSSSSSGSSALPASVAQATKTAQAAFTVPTQIPITDPLPTKPPKKTAAFLEPQIPAGKSQTQGFKNAAAAIGWNLKVIPADPFKPAGAVQQAIDDKVDYIFMTGVPTALFLPQMKAAKAAGIPILMCFGTDDPGPKNPDLVAQCGDGTSAIDDGKLLADWGIGDSKGKAHVLIVTVPDYPILQAQVQGYKQEMSAKCPSCKVSELGVTLDELAKGAVPNSIASKLQADPSIDYVFFTFSDAPTGVYQTLKGAGLADQVKMYGLDFNEALLKQLQAGTYATALGLPKEYAAWLQFHMAALLSEHQPLTKEREWANLPRILVGKDQAGQYINTNFQWPGPVGFQEQFKKLWHVG